MKIKEYRVIDPAGVVWNGDIVVLGGTIAAPTADGRIKAYLHFRQVQVEETVGETAAPLAAEAVVPAIGTLNPEPGQSAALVETAEGLPIIASGSAPMAGGEFVAAPVGVVTETADGAELSEDAAAPTRAKRKPAAK